MGNGRKTTCVLCRRSEETKITGALATKEQVTAHQNCLLYSSGIFCTDSPLLHDLFGFSVDDVLDEVKRGSKLACYYCKKKGATAGCENGRCKKSFHYPCAVQEGAGIFEDHENGKFGLFCLKHREQINGDSANELQKPRPARAPSEAGPTKVYCLACEKTEGNISLASLTNSIVMSYCDKHATSSHKRRSNGGSSAAGPSSHSSDSSAATHCSSKRRLSLGDPEEKESPSKRKSKGWKRIASDDSSNSDNELIPPLESDLDDSANSVPPTVPQLISTHSEKPTGSPAGNQVADEVGEENNAEETFISSDTESESLLPPVKDYVISGASAALPRLVSVGMQTVKKEPSTQESSPVPPPSPGRCQPHHVAGSPPCSSSVIPPAPPSHSQPGIDSASFWRSCNEAGCTQAIFTDFMNGMNDICSRIQAGQASQEDYSCALSVMAASGRLVEFVAKQQEELQRKQTELQKAAAAMKEVVSALKK
ncbi:uncharacterized protein phf11 [Odontesthes bonariensis]|uniref:uncharacterized protein phf11 n=1 Tax=Odontesthes bonariensis TaxID=219752 RepID=UPI003F586CDA